MKGLSLFVASVVLCAGAIRGAAEDRFVKELRLAAGLTAVVAEGDLEPRAAGTYTVRVYKDVKSGAFVSGITREREGAILNVGLTEPDKDGKKRLFVETRVASLENFVNVDVFDFDGALLKLNPKLSRASLPEESKDDAEARKLQVSDEKKPEVVKPADAEKKAEAAKPVEEPAKPAEAKPAEEKKAEPANAEPEKPKVEEKAAAAEPAAVPEPTTEKPNP